VTVTLPSGTEMHLGVYGITERDHFEIQKRRRDFIALVMYLTERKLFFSVNHVFSGLTGRREEEDFSWFASYAPAFEIRNGAMWSEANASATRLAKKWGKVGLGGSDAHTMAGVGLTYTEVRGARTVDEFIAGLDGPRERARSAWELRKSDGRCLSDRWRIFSREAVGGGDCSAHRVGAGHHIWALAERDSVLPEVGDDFGKWREAAADVVEVGAWSWLGSGELNVVGRMVLEVEAGRSPSKLRVCNKLRSYRSHRT